MQNAQSPDMSDAGLEPRLQAESKAPRVSREQMLATIVGEAYHRLTPTLTVCVLTLRNGFTVTGESACASPENYQEDVGNRLAREAAERKVWPLEGYLLRERLHMIAQAMAGAGEQSYVAGIARMCHEVNRAYCQSMGDNSQPAWEDAPQWQKDSAINGVRMHLAKPDATPRDSHASWLAEKSAAGWTWGPVKDPEKKQHPCFTDYDSLPPEQRAKDWLFRGVVHAMSTRQ